MLRTKLNAAIPSTIFAGVTMMSMVNRLATLEQFFKDVAELTLGCELISDTAVVCPAALGVSLRGVDPDWYCNAPARFSRRP